MDRGKKFWILLVASVALTALVLLAASLSNLELLPGQPFPWGLFNRQSEVPPLIGGPDGTFLITILRILLLITLVITAIYVIFSREGRRQAVRAILELLLLLFLMSFFVERQTALVPTPDETMTESSPAEEIPFGTPPEFNPGDMRDLTNTLTLALAIVLTVIILAVLYILWRRAHLPKDSTMIELAREAQDALEAIQAGGSVKNAVIRCYVEMSRVVSEKRNLYRGVTMTSHEFEEHLIRAGLPKTPIHQLTRLFEDARYGDQEPGPAEEQGAVACLSAIVAAATEAAR